MKKIIVILIMLLMVIPLNVFATVNQDNLSLLENAKSGILVEASTGEILYEKNKDEKVSIASLTKMAAQIIILENIENGNLKWDEIITASSNAASMGGTQIWLTAGEKISVEDLFKGMTMASANDVAVTKKQSLVISEEIII